MFFILIVVPGLENYVPISNLLNLGFKLVYDYPYSHFTSYDEIEAIRAECISSTIMCVGGGNQSDGLLRVVACGNCLNITTLTQLGQTTFSGSAYWYFAFGYSFGFAPDPLIDLISADLQDLSSNLRLSWYLDEYNGGYRLGDLIGLFNDNIYYKKVFLSDISEHIR